MSLIYNASSEDQLKYSSVIRKSFPNTIPVIVIPANKKLPDLTKEKFLTKSDTKAYLFYNMVRKYVKLTQNQGIYLFVDDRIINGNTTIGSLFNEYNKNGILFVKYDIENVFGE